MASPTFTVGSPVLSLWIEGSGGVHGGGLQLETRVAETCLQSELYAGQRGEACAELTVFLVEREGRQGSWGTDDGEILLGVVGVVGDVRHFVGEMGEDFVGVPDEVEEYDGFPGGLFFVPFSTRVGQLKV